MGNQIKLIASDLDGTLLLNDAQECSQELYGLVEALSARGILFVPASGRQYASLKRLFAPVHDKIMYLCENGALVMKGEVPLFQKGFERELAMEIGQAICGIPDCHLMVCCPKSSYTMASSEEFAAYMREEIGYEIGTVEHLEEITEPILKVSVSMQPHLRAGIKQKLQPLFEGRCNIAESGDFWIDFAPFGISKGSGLQELGRILNIDASEMAAFGDNENDRAMLEYVGHPYLMEKCNPVVEDIPAVRCRRVEEELEKILLGFS